MAVVAEAKRQVVVRNQNHKTDTGSPEVQIALLTDRLEQLKQHFKAHQKVHAARGGLLIIVARRRRLLTFLMVHSPERYKRVLEKPGNPHQSNPRFLLRSSAKRTRIRRPCIGREPQSVPHVPADPSCQLPRKKAPDGFPSGEKEQPGNVTRL